MDYQDSWWNISVSSVVILAASIFDISCGKIDRQTRRQTNASKNRTPVTTVLILRVK